MTFEQVISIITLRLGNRQDLRLKAMAEVLLAQEYEIEQQVQFNPWFLLTVDFQDIVVPVDQGYVDMPTDFIAPYENGFLYAVNADGQQLSEPMPFDTYDVGRARNSTDSSVEGQLTGEEPSRASLVNNRLYVFPTNTRALTFKARYYQKQATLTADAPETHVILKYAGDWLTAEAGKNVALYDQQEKVAALFEKEAMVAKRRVEMESDARLYAEADRLRGGSR